MTTKDNTKLLQELVVSARIAKTVSLEDAVKQAIEAEFGTDEKKVLADALGLDKDLRKQLFGEATDETTAAGCAILQAATDANAFDAPEGTKLRVELVEGKWRKLVGAARTGVAKPAFRWTIELMQMAGVTDVRNGAGELCKRNDKPTSASTDALSYLHTVHPNVCYSERVCTHTSGYASAEEALADSNFVKHLEETGRKSEKKVKEDWPEFKHGSNAGQLAAQLAPDDASSRVGIHAASPLYDRLEGAEVGGRKVIGMSAFWEELKKWYSEQQAEASSDDTEAADEPTDEQTDEPTEDELAAIEEEAEAAVTA